jgi:tRNA-(ms[2]io[6]A)-hydroxylase
MARDVDAVEADRRLEFYLELDAKLIREPNPLPMLH